VLEVFACNSLGIALVWCAVFGDDVSVLEEHTVEMWPSTLAALTHRIAVQDLLCGQLWDFSSIFELKTRLDGLVEGLGVAGATLSLVTHGVREVVALNRAEIMARWDLVIWNLL